jgi:hypothetical protein
MRCWAATLLGRTPLSFGTLWIVEKLVEDVIQLKRFIEISVVKVGR